MNLDFRYDSGTIEVKEMVEIVGNLCELEGVAKVMCNTIKKAKHQDQIKMWKNRINKNYRAKIKAYLIFM